MNALAKCELKQAEIRHFWPHFGQIEAVTWTIRPPLRECRPGRRTGQAETLPTAGTRRPMPGDFGPENPLQEYEQPSRERDEIQWNRSNAPQRQKRRTTSLQPQEAEETNGQSDYPQMSWSKKEKGRAWA